MIPSLPAETALVLGGGGAKGGYEIGVLDALTRLGITVTSVCGVSVGALNGALFAQGAMEEAERIWTDIRLSDVVAPESAALADAAENVFNHPEKLLGFLSQYKKNMGVDITPLEELLRRTLREDVIRASAIRFSLVTTKVNGLSLVRKSIVEMSSGSLCDWLLASAACFPVFPLRSIGGELYADGGFCDNTPVACALRDGAQHVIAVDIGKHRSHTKYDRRPNVTYIRTRRSLGGLMTFDPARSAFNRRLGCNDTLLAFGLLRGFSYAFDPKDALRCADRARDFVSRLSIAEAALQPARAVSLGSRDKAPFFSLLEGGIEDAMDCVDYFLRACELAADIAELDPTPVYTLHTFSEALRAALPLEQAETLAASLMNGHAGALFSKPALDRRLAVSCLYCVIQKSGMDFPLAGYAASSFPREFLCALTLLYLL